MYVLVLEEGLLPHAFDLHHFFLYLLQLVDRTGLGLTAAVSCQPEKTNSFESHDFLPAISLSRPSSPSVEVSYMVARSCMTDDKIM